MTVIARSTWSLALAQCQRQRLRPGPCQPYQILPRPRLSATRDHHPAPARHHADRSLIITFVTVTVTGCGCGCGYGFSFSFGHEPPSLVLLAGSRHSSPSTYKPYTSSRVSSTRLLQRTNPVDTATYVHESCLHVSPSILSSRFSSPALPPHSVMCPPFACPVPRLPPCLCSRLQSTAFRNLIRAATWPGASHDTSSLWDGFARGPEHRHPFVSLI